MRAGPIPRSNAAVIVSLTEFKADRLRDLPGIVREGIGLTRGWWALPGAVGVSLYLDLTRRTGGSISVWRSEADLRRFVSLPRHLAIVRRYRSRVTVRSATWETQDFRAAEVHAQRHALLLGDASPAGVAVRVNQRGHRL